MIAVIATSEAWTRGDKLALWALCVAIAGLLIAWRTLRRGNLNASVATASALMADIQVSLNEYIRSIPTPNTELSEELEAGPETSSLEWSEQQQAEMTEKLELLMNRLEMASAICVERSLFGISRTLVGSYVQDVLKVIIENHYARVEAGKLLHNEETFKYIRWFMAIAPPRSVTVPPEWYVRYKPIFIEWLRVKTGWAAQ